MNAHLTLHEKLKYLRVQNNLSQNAIADYLNISRQAVSQWERGITYPDIENITMLCKLYNISIEQLLDSNQDISCNPKSVESNSSISQQPKTFSIEFLCLAVILTLSAQFPFLGIIVPILVVAWQKKYKKRYYFIYILCIFCFIFSMYNTYAMISHLFFDIGSATITPMQ